MRPERAPSECENPNIFTSIYENAISPRLPNAGSLTDRVMTHTTGARPFFETVSRELCENERITAESGERALSFIARSATTGVTVAGTGALVGFGLVAGSPLVALGAGIVGLAVLPPLADRLATGVASLFADITTQIGSVLTGSSKSM